LIAELRRRAAERGLAIVAEVADVRRLRLGRRFAAILAPMQLVQLLDGVPGRGAMLAACAEHIDRGGTLAAALLAEDAIAEARPSGPAERGAGPLPDVREVDGWVFSSLPVEVRIGDREIEVRRLRQLVSPAGELSERASTVWLDRVDADAFEAEAEAAGFRPRERIGIPSTADHVGSVVCVLEAA
jgi:hypothetical protein